MQEPSSSQPAMQPAYGQQAPYGAPDQRVVELRIPVANLPSMLKILIFNLCALGLVLALIVPWVHLEMDLGDENLDASYDGKLQRLDTPEEDDGMPEDLGEAMEAAGYYNVEEHYDRGLATTGFILLLIILGAAVFLRLANLLPQRVSSAVQVALVSIALLPAAMATVAGMRFIGGFGIAYDSMLKAMEDMTEVEASISALGGWAVAIVGLFILVLLVFELFRELRLTHAHAATGGQWPWSGSVAKRLLFGMVLLSVIGIVLVPLTPWTSFEPEDEDFDRFYQDEGMIHGRAEGSDTGYDVARDMRRDVKYVTGMFYMTLVFAIVGLMAMALQNLGAPGMAFKAVMLAGAMGFLFPLFGLLSHVGFMGHAKELEIAVGEGEVAFAAYAPLVVALVLLLAALAYLAMVARQLFGGKGPAMPFVEQAPYVPPPVADPGMPVAVAGADVVVEEPRDEPEATVPVTEEPKADGPAVEDGTERGEEATDEVDDEEDGGETHD